MRDVKHVVIDSFRPAPLPLELQIAISSATSSNALDEDDKMDKQWQCVHENIRSLVNAVACCAREYISTAIHFDTQSALNRVTQLAKHDNDHTGDTFGFSRAIAAIAIGTDCRLLHRTSVELSDVALITTISRKFIDACMAVAHLTTLFPILLCLPRLQLRDELLRLARFALHAGISDQHHQAWTRQPIWLPCIP